MRRLSSGVLVLVLATPAHGGAGWEPLRYLGCRLADLLDALELNVGVGPGAKVDVKYGISFLGVGRVRALRVGVVGRRPSIWWESDRQAGLFPFSLLAWPPYGLGRLLNERELAEKALWIAVSGSLGHQSIEREELTTGGGLLVKEVVKMWRHTRWGDSLPVGAEVHGGLIGVRVLVRPLQLADFVVGIVGLDLDPWLAKTPF